MASTLRWRTPPRWSGRPPSRTSSGPRKRKSSRRSTARRYRLPAGCQRLESAAALCSGGRFTPTAGGSPPCPPSPAHRRCLAATLLLPASAGAAQRERVLVERVTFPYDGAADCGAFAIEFAGVQRFKAWDIFEGGELVQTVFIQGFKETDTHSVTGATLPLRGQVREVWEYDKGTRTISGAVYMGNRPGAGHLGARLGPDHDDARGPDRLLHRRPEGGLLRRRASTRRLPRCSPSSSRGARSISASSRAQNSRRATGVVALRARGGRGRPPSRTTSEAPAARRSPRAARRVPTTRSSRARERDDRAPRGICRRRAPGSRRRAPRKPPPGVGGEDGARHRQPDARAIAA